MGRVLPHLRAVRGRARVPLIARPFPFPGPRLIEVRLSALDLRQASRWSRILHTDRRCLDPSRKGKVLTFSFLPSDASVLDRALARAGFPPTDPPLGLLPVRFEDPPRWRLPGPRPFAWGRRTVVMGILNVTPDSFSDGGRFLDPEAALEHALRMEAEGADWIDVGGESTRPGSRGVPAAVEAQRVVPVVRLLSRRLRIPLSVDTSKASVAREAVRAGAALVNDVGALGFDPKMAETCAKLRVPVVLMHLKGRPRTMQRNPRYGDLMGEIAAFLRARIARAREAGIREDALLVDPGFGFGKTPAHNLEMTMRLGELKGLGRPVLFGPSRKSTLGAVLGGAPPQERLEATLAAVTAGILAGADWVRVHDVQSAVRAARMADALRYGWKEA